MNYNKWRKLFFLFRGGMRGQFNIYRRNFIFISSTSIEHSSTSKQILTCQYWYAYHVWEPLVYTKEVVVYYWKSCKKTMFIEIRISMIIYIINTMMNLNNLWILKAVPLLFMPITVKEYFYLIWEQAFEKYGS